MVKYTRPGRVVPIQLLFSLRTRTESLCRKSSRREEDGGRHAHRPRLPSDARQNVPVRHAQPVRLQGGRSYPPGARLAAQEGRHPSLALDLSWGVAGHGPL
jgi:hypothetical protein